MFSVDPQLDGAYGSDSSISFLPAAHSGNLTGIWFLATLFVWGALIPRRCFSVSFGCVGLDRL